MSMRLEEESWTLAYRLPDKRLLYEIRDGCYADILSLDINTNFPSENVHH